MKLKTSQKGFTLVELLIVIVVIAILAAITIVAYNGLTQRATKTANQETANQLRTKVTAWQGVKGSYPTVAEVIDTDNNGGLNDADVKEAALEQSVVDKIRTPAASPTADKPLSYTQCNSGAGARVSYFVPSETAGVFNIGDTSGC